MKVGAALACVVGLLAGVACAGEILSLPGFDGPLPSRMYSGYQTVNASVGRRLFYIFVEAQLDPENAPVVLWLNGGPGCSSLFGFFTEHGPVNMRFASEGRGLEANPYTWTKVANVIYMESPAFVGFSTSNDTEDNYVGDARTASDSYKFLLHFFKEFPQFKQNPFYVTGESYGGHYVPELVNEILIMNPTKKPHKRINLQGLMAGNPWTAPDIEAFGVIENWYQHNIISKNTYKILQNECTVADLTSWIIYNVSVGVPLSERARRARVAHMPLEEFFERFPSPKGPAAQKACFAALEQTIVETGGNNFNILQLFGDVCNPGTSGDIPDQPNVCNVNQMQIYLNLPEVRAALHVSDPQPLEWLPCSPTVVYNFSDTVNSVFPIYQKLMNTSLKVFIFSGDMDAIVPFTATRKWIEALNRTVVNDFHAWLADTNGQQIGGWATQYDRITFTTVRGTGHMVATTQPQRALHIFRAFLANGTV